MGLERAAPVGSCPMCEGKRKRLGYSHQSCLSLLRYRMGRTFLFHEVS